MSIEQKNEKNRKCREARQRNKGLPIKLVSSRGAANLNFVVVIPTCPYIIFIELLLPFVPPFIWLMLE
jgi:hypothetical protein